MHFSLPCPDLLGDLGQVNSPFREGPSFLFLKMSPDLTLGFYDPPNVQANSITRVWVLVCGDNPGVIGFPGTGSLQDKEKAQDIQSLRTWVMGLGRSCGRSGVRRPPPCDS